MTTPDMTSERCVIAGDRYRFSVMRLQRVQFEVPGHCTGRGPRRLYSRQEGNRAPLAGMGRNPLATVPDAPDAPAAPLYERLADDLAHLVATGALKIGD